MLQQTALVALGVRTDLWTESDDQQGLSDGWPQLREAWRITLLHGRKTGARQAIDGREIDGGDLGCRNQRQEAHFISWRSQPGTQGSDWRRRIAL
jgi:hypothetical protein